MTKLCITCNAGFIDKTCNKNKKYCSRRCKEIVQLRHRTPLIKQCIVCQDLFQCHKFVPQTTVCSRQCREVRKRLYNVEHREEISTYHRNKYNHDINYRIAKNLRVRLYCALDGDQKVGSAVNDLGCSVDDLKTYLASKFELNMTWDNYGEWHIDHVTPLSSYDLTSSEQLKLACCYTNLQPLWAEDNFRKSNKLPSR